MAKSKPWFIHYVEPPPTTDSFAPGRGVWSTTTGISVVDNTRDALRQAIIDALHRLPPGISETLPPRTFPPELCFDAWYSLQFEGHRSPLRSMTSWLPSVQRFRQLLRAAGHEHLLEASANNERRITGAAELHIERSWRFGAGHQSRDEVRKGILDDFTRALDRELDSVYTECKRPRPSSRRNLDRDATRLVLRRYLGLFDDQIQDYEAGYTVTLANGRTLERPDADPVAEESSRDAIDQSIKNLEVAAGLSPQQRKRGRRPKPPPDDDPIYRDFLA